MCILCYVMLCMFAMRASMYACLLHHMCMFVMSACNYMNVPELCYIYIYLVMS